MKINDFKIGNTYKKIDEFSAGSIWQMVDCDTDDNPVLKCIFNNTGDNFWKVGEIYNVEDNWQAKNFKELK